MTVGDDAYTVEEEKTQQYDPSHGEHVSDLATMNNLAEGPLLDVLRRRYYNDLIYTFVGDILVSFNPYVVIPGIYDIPTIAPAVTSGTSRAIRDDPHVFTVAERTYCDMMLNKCDQSLIVSGESGAGKTEACKRVMTYLTAISRAKTKALQKNTTTKMLGVENIEDKVLRCNPFLEAFGNAKTNRNDNSSRFGKFLRLEFYNGRIVGASMKHYLLEKSRIVEPGKRRMGVCLVFFCCGVFHCMDRGWLVAMASHVSHLDFNMCTLLFFFSWFSFHQGLGKGPTIFFISCCAVRLLRKKQPCI